MFAFFLYGYFPIVYLLYPETTRRTLEDMDVIFRTNPAPFVFRNKNLTQRARPQIFIEAERDRVAAGEALKQGREILGEGKNSAQSYIERVV